MKLITNYLNSLQEQFNVSVGIASVKSEMNREWTDCFSTRCDNIEIKYEKMFCKAGCMITATNRSITRLSTLKSSCRRAENPSSCLKRIDSTIKNLQEKIQQYREMQSDSRDKAREFRRKQAAGV